MEHNSKYEVEIKRFRHAFANLKDKRIAIYALVEEVQHFYLV